MRIKNSTNSQISGTDFAAGERQAALRTMHRSRLGPARAVSSGWGEDVAKNDRRSVHAWLRGKGDLRGAWWNLYSRVYLAAVPGADLERAMYSFHCIHHAMTLGWLSYVMSVRKTSADIRHVGLIAAVRAAAADNSRTLR
ncbi:hypothetical protein [Massilia sp. LjRoot122]|uniref:hypothetical protein n=1 Tax=Massilia sp. LjRoot122 TaxID=3342257 RepID=UPI003ED0633D